MLGIMHDPQSHGSGHHHGHDHPHERDHRPRSGLTARFPGWLHPHSHEPAEQRDRAGHRDDGGLDQRGDAQHRQRDPQRSHALPAGFHGRVDRDITAVQAHQVAVAAEHALLHAIPRLAAALVHADPQPHGGTDPHQVLAAHRKSAQ